VALYIERGVKHRRLDAATRIGLTFLSRLFDWRDALTVVSPATLIRWHRAGWRLFWRMKSRPGRPPIPGTQNLRLTDALAINCNGWVLATGFLAQPNLPPGAMPGWRIVPARDQRSGRGVTATTA
jgi:hypothetical protein